MTRLAGASKKAMRIVGISGLSRIVSFKRRLWPGLGEREYTISPGHDSAAALVVDGKPVAAAKEENFNHFRHSGDFPVQAMQYCLSEKAFDSDDIDLLVHAYNHSEYEELYLEAENTAELYRTVLSKEALLQEVRRYLPNFREDRLEQVPHHLAHGASAYFSSGWEECAVLVADGVSDGPSLTVYHARGAELKEIQEVFAANSIGIFFGLVAMHLGLDFRGDQDRIIGLSREGDPHRFRTFFDKAIQLGRGGTVLIAPLWRNKTREEREFYLATRQYLSDKLGPARNSDEELSQTHKDIAAGLQECVLRVVLHVCEHIRTVTGLPRIALAGDVALNYQVNGGLMQSAIFDDVFVAPAPGNDGAALGAALLCARRNREIKKIGSQIPFYGPGYSNEDMTAACKEFGTRLKSTPLQDLDHCCSEAARLLTEGKTIVWYRGRMEFGPFALGHRNILAIPRSSRVQQWLGKVGSGLEAFVSVGAVVSGEQAHLWADLPAGIQLPYMNITVPVRKPLWNLLSGLIDSQGKIRFQTVNKDQNPDFHCLLKEVGKKTGRELLLSASFPANGGTMVESPHQAIETFLSAEIDYLFLGNLLVWRSGDVLHSPKLVRRNNSVKPELENALSGPGSLANA
jgi:carbamoyltransferase